MRGCDEVREKSKRKRRWTDKENGGQGQDIWKEMRCRGLYR